MKYYIDEKEVTEQEFKEKIWSQCIIHIINNHDAYFKEMKHLYNQLSPLEKTLGDYMMGKKEMQKYENQKEFEINGFRFKRE